MSTAVRYHSLAPGCGYGDAAVEYILALRESGIEVSWEPLLQVPAGYAPLSRLRDDERPRLEPELDAHRPAYECLLRDIDCDVVLLHVIPELFPRLRRGDASNVGITVWETDRLPAHWLPLLRSVDRLAVPCDFNLDLFAIPAGPPVSLLPHMPPVDDGIPDAGRVAGMRARLGAGPGTMIFYSISAWAPRKAVWETLHAYLLAFTADDDVRLVFKTDRAGYDYGTGRRPRLRSTRDMIAEVCGVYPDPAPVSVLDETLPRAEVDLLHHACDCYVSLSHGEGWGLGAFNAVCVGNPVIITGWGGQLDYLPREYAWLVDYRLEPLRTFPLWDSYEQGQRWARADVDHAVESLREAYHDRAGARARGAALARHVATGFSRESVRRQLLSLVDARDP